MGAEIIQHQMNGARRGITVRHPFKCSRELRRSTIFRGVGLMATGFELDHAEHIGCRRAPTRSRGAQAGRAPSRWPAAASPTTAPAARPAPLPAHVYPTVGSALPVPLSSASGTPRRAAARTAFFSRHGFGAWLTKRRRMVSRRPCRPLRAAGLPVPSARCSSARFRVAAARTPWPRSQPAG